MKKIFAALLVMTVLLGSIGVGFAASSPSVNDLTTTDVISQSNVVIQPASENVAELNTAIQELVKVVETQKIAAVFPAETQKAIAAALPAEVAVEELVLSEMFAIEALNADLVPEEGLVVELALPTDFSQTGDVVVLIAFTKDGKMLTEYTFDALFGADSDVEWFVLDTEKTADGNIKVKFTAEQIKRMGGQGNAVLTVLSASAIDG